MNKIKILTVIISILLFLSAFYILSNKTWEWFIMDQYILQTEWERNITTTKEMTSFLLNIKDLKKEITINIDTDSQDAKITEIYALYKDLFWREFTKLTNDWVDRSNLRMVKLNMKESFLSSQIWWLVVISSLESDRKYYVSID